MPYRSEKQRRYMHAVHPDIAARWDTEYGGKIVPSAKSKGHAAHDRKHSKRKDSHK